MTALNLAILVGIAILGAAGYTWLSWDVGRLKEQNVRQGEINESLWRHLQREIDSYREPEEQLPDGCESGVFPSRKTLDNIVRDAKHCGGDFIMFSSGPVPNPFYEKFVNEKAGEPK